MPATTWDGLESTGGPTGWWEDAWDKSHPFEGFVRSIDLAGIADPCPFSFMAPSKMESREDISRTIHRALVEVFTLREAGRLTEVPVGIEETLQADFYRDVAFKQDADGITVAIFIHKRLREDILDSLTYETEYKFSNEDEDEDSHGNTLTGEDFAEAMLENRPTDENWLNVSFNDNAVKFSVSEIP